MKNKTTEQELAHSLFLNHATYTFVVSEETDTRISPAKKQRRPVELREVAYLRDAEDKLNLTNMFYPIPYHIGITLKDDKESLIKLMMFLHDTGEFKRFPNRNEHRICDYRIVPHPQRSFVFPAEQLKKSESKYGKRSN